MEFTVISETTGLDLSRAARVRRSFPGSVQPMANGQVLHGRALWRRHGHERHQIIPLIAQGQNSRWEPSMNAHSNSRDEMRLYAELHNGHRNVTNQLPCPLR